MLFLFALVAVLALAMLAGCSKKGPGSGYGGPNGGSGAGSGTGSNTRGGGSGGSGSQTKQDKAQDHIPPNAIWALNGTVKYKADLGNSIYDNITLDLDFSKLEGNYPSGKYVGDVYINEVLDASQYAKNFSNLTHGLASIHANVEAYGLRDQMPVTVQGLQDFQKGGNTWPATADASGKQVSPGKEEYVANTTFAMAGEAKGSGGGQGNAGSGTVKVGDLSMSGSGQYDVTLRFIIEPDSVWGDSFYESATGTRKVQIFATISSSSHKAVSFSGEGTLTRQKGGSQAVQDYNSSHESLGKKYGVSATN